MRLPMPAEPHPSEMEPMLPSDGHLRNLAMEVAQAAAGLGASVSLGTRRGLVELLRTVNCYYSNRIEGHDTRPADIERAMRDDLASDPGIRALQREARAHIEVQRLVEGWIGDDPALDIASAEFLRRVHREFYARVPEELRWVADPATGQRAAVEPGALRTRAVVIGRHLPPPASALPGFLARFAEAYTPHRLGRAERVVAMAASHHRLMWIHPFLDGNGRVARLFTLAYATRGAVEGEGLWSVSRGLARRRDGYMAALAAADEPRRDDYDGRGALSLAALVEFCTFFLETCLDQIEYMRGLLRLETFAERLVSYGQLRASGLAAPPRAVGDTGALHARAGLLLREVMLRGEVPRGEAARITGLGERTARTVLGDLVREGLLVADGPKLPVRLGFPVHAVGYWFPELYPAG